jgi:hypothetical protein
LTIDEALKRPCPECEIAGTPRSFMPSGWGAHRRAAHGIAGMSPKAREDRENLVVCPICQVEGKTPRKSVSAGYFGQHLRSVHGILPGRADPMGVAKAAAHRTRMASLPDISTADPLVQAEFITRSPMAEQLTFSLAKDMVVQHCSDGSIWIAQKVIS